LLILRTTTPQPNYLATWEIPPLSKGFLGNKRYQVCCDGTDKRYLTLGLLSVLAISPGSFLRVATVVQKDVGAFGTVEQKDVVAAGTVRKSWFCPGKESTSAVSHQSSVISPGLNVIDPMLGCWGWPFFRGHPPLPRVCRVTPARAYTGWCRSFRHGVRFRSVEETSPVQLPSYLSSWVLSIVSCFLTPIKAQNYMFWLGEPLETDLAYLSGNCGLTQCEVQAVTSRDSKPEGGCASCVVNTRSLNPESGVASPVETPGEGAFEPLDSTGVKGEVGTTREGAVNPLESTRVKSPVV